MAVSATWLGCDSPLPHRDRNVGRSSSVRRRCNAKAVWSGWSPGDRYAITTVHGDRFEGQVILNRALTEFAGTVDNLDRCLLRFGIETYKLRPEATFWLSTWGEPDLAAGLRARWRATFDELFA